MNKYLFVFVCLMFNISVVYAEAPSTAPSTIQAPVAGELEKITKGGKCGGEKWCFNQHGTGGHVEHGGIGDGNSRANDSKAWDINLNSPNYDADNGKPVCAVADGTIYTGGMWAGKHKAGQILINHPLKKGEEKKYYDEKGNLMDKGWSSAYLHMKDIVKMEGEVKKGEVIGYISNVGVPPDENGNKPIHLHFAVYVTPGGAFDLNKKEITLESKDVDFTELSSCGDQVKITPNIDDTNTTSSQVIKFNKDINSTNKDKKIEVVKENVKPEYKAETISLGKGLIAESICAFPGNYYSGYTADSSILAPGQKFVKTWVFKNEGNTTWEKGEIGIAPCKTLDYKSPCEFAEKSKFSSENPEYLIHRDVPAKTQYAFRVDNLEAPANLTTDQERWVVYRKNDDNKDPITKGGVTVKVTVKGNKKDVKVPDCQFTDLGQVTPSQKMGITELCKMGVVRDSTVDNSLKFDPRLEISRAEVSKIIANMCTTEIVATRDKKYADGVFTDVSGLGDMLEPIKSLYNAEVISGYTKEKEFRPNGPIDIGSMAKMVMKGVIGLGVTDSLNGKWTEEFKSCAETLGLVPNEVDYNRFATRAEVAESVMKGYNLWKGYFEGTSPAPSCNTN